MNDKFNAGRFGKYFSYDLKRTFTEHGLTILTFSLAGAIFYFFIKIINLIGGRLDITEYGAGVGPEGRFIVFAMVFFLFMILIPAALYGSVTDRKKGTSFLMLPASALEKSITMILITCIISPVVFVLIYLSADWIITLLDPSHCGKSILSFLGNFNNDNGVIDINGMNEKLTSLPAFMLATVFQMIYNIMFFLLGAIVFKKNKVVLTIASVMAISTALSFVLVIAMRAVGADWFSTQIDAQPLHFINSLMVWTLIFNILITIGMSIAVYFRVKTIKQ